MRILFFGLPLAAVLLHADGHEIVHACLCRPGCPGERRLRARLGPDRVEVKPNLAQRAVVTRLAGFEVDLLVSWFWTTRIPKALLSRPRWGTLGVHPSLLPRHRGPDPYFWAIDAGDAITGVSAHTLGEEYDTGAVYARRELAIDPSWNAWTLARKLDRPSLALLREVAAAFARGAPPTPEPQDERFATQAPAPDEEQLALDWSRPAEALVRRVRAAAPSPGAYTHLNDVPVTLTRARALPEAPKALLPGEAFALARDDAGAPARAAVRCAEGALELLEGFTEDDDGEPEPLGPRDLARLVFGIDRG